MNWQDSCLFVYWVDWHPLPYIFQTPVPIIEKAREDKLDGRAIACLQKLINGRNWDKKFIGVTYIHELVGITTYDLLNMNNCGVVSAGKIKEWLESNGLKMAK